MKNKPITFKLRVALFRTLWRLRLSQWRKWLVWFLLYTTRSDGVKTLGRAPAFVFYAIAVTALTLDKVLGNNRSAVIRAEPISGTAILFSILASVGSFAAQYALTALTRQKPKPVTRGKLSGDISITDSVLGAPQVRVYGGRPEGSNDGGCEVGPNIFWSSNIRKLTTTTPGTGGGKGLGGGSQPTPTTTTILYKVDCAGGFGPGPLRLLRLKFNEDTMYDLISGSGGPGTNEYTYYEAEDPGNTLSGGATVEADSDCSGHFKVAGIGNGGALIFNDVEGSGKRRFLVAYKSATDTICNIKIDGVGSGTYTFPATATGIVGQKFFIRIVPTGGTGLHTVEFSNPDADGPEIDKIGVAEPIEVTFDPTGGGGPIGGHDPHFPGERPLNNLLMPDPREEDTNAIERFNLNVEPDPTDGTLSVTLPGGTEMCFYEGNDHQPIDSVISAQITSQYGAGYCPAFLDTSFIRLQDLDLSKWGGLFPQIRAVLENTLNQTVEEILLTEAFLVGLLPDDFDLSAAASKHSRGYYVPNIQAPEDAFEDLGRLFNLSFVESVDGKIIAIDLADRTPKATLTNNHLGGYIADEQTEPPHDLVTSTVPAETEMIRELEIEFHDPAPPLNLQVGQRADIFPFTTSRRKEKLTFPSTLTGDEALRIVRRLLQNEWLKAVPHKFVLTHEHAWLNAGDPIIIPIAGENKLVRIEEKIGSAPGIIECVASPDELFVIAGEEPPDSSTGDQLTKGVKVPANSIATFMSIPRLEDAQNKGGIYAAAAPKDLTNGAVWPGAIACRLKGDVFQNMATFTAPACMGRVVDAALADGSGFGDEDWDDTSSVIADFFGDRTPTSVTEDQALEGINGYMVGNELTIITTWTRDNDYPNRWAGTHLRRHVRQTPPDDHVLYERVVLFDSAIRFIALDADEKDVEREWRVPTVGQDVTYCAPIMVTWAGETIIKDPVYDTIDRDVPLVTVGPTITRIDQPGVTEWGIYMFRPDDFGFSADNVEVRIRDASDLVVVRQLQIGNTSYHRHPMFTFDCVVDYRWRNRHRTGGSDGWSAWSPTAVAYGLDKIAVQQNTPDSELVTFDNDPNDQSNPDTRKTEYGKDLYE